MHELLHRLRAWAFATLERATAAAGRVGAGRRLPLLRPIYFRLRRRLQPRVFRLDGAILRVHPNEHGLTHALTITGTFEPQVAAVLDAALAPGSAFVDVGANVGYHTVRAARVVGPSGRVVAVEPEPRNLTLLRTNVAANGFANVSVVPVAAGSTAGRLRLYESATNLGDHRLYPVPGRSGHEVSVEPLDAVLDRHGVVPDVVKIDVQGFEHEVVSGRRATLAQADSCVLVSELWDEGLRDAGSSAEGYAALLGEIGFELYELLEDGRVRPLELTTLAGCDTNILGLLRVPGPAARRLLG